MIRQPVPRTSIDELIERYDLLLFDAYGVLVHASGAMPGAPETVARLNQANKAYAVLTNDASKLPEVAAQRYQGFGLDISTERILSSGLLLRDYFQQHRLQGADCVVLGTADSERFVERAGGNVVPAGTACDVLVVGDENGYQFVETVDATISTLFRSIDRGDSVRLVLPNPDLIFPHGEDRFGIAAGSVALMIEAALRRRYPLRSDLVFDRLGKPHPELYESAMIRSGTRNAVMIGDQLETDIAGAVTCDIDSALIATGVAIVDESTNAASIRPTYWMPSLRDE
ncbi:MAG: HAD hydrolase-like protein [Betaproteobacteria bacterium]|nr:MAG: HAD hydrolase-like protein [Betaproteobacteria bacterium]